MRKTLDIFAVLSVSMSMAVIFFSGEFSRAEEPPKKLEGCCGYKFGMTMQQAIGVNAEARWEDFNVGGSKKERHLVRDSTFYGEPGRIIVSFNQHQFLDGILIHFERFEGRCNEILLKTVYDGLVASYGVKYLKSVSFPTARWQFPQGGVIELTNMCIARDEADFKSDRPQGMIIVRYTTSEGF